MQKIWEQLNKDFKSSRTDESSRFLGELPFEIDSFIPGYASSSDVDTSNRLSCRIAGVKHKPVVSPGVHSSHRLKKIRPNVEPAVNFAFDSRKSTKNYKFVHRSTVVRQAARIKDLRAKNSDSKREMAEKNLTILGLSCELKRTHTEHRALTLKLKEMSSMHEKICQASNVYRKKWEDAKSDIRFLSNKLLELEELQMNADHVESKLDDPDFEIDSAIEKANDDFAAGNFPKMKVRNSIKEINPKIYLGIILIRNIGRVSLENTMPLLAALANSIFGQSWELGNFTPKTRQRHALPPCQNKEDRPTKKKILENTLPAKSFTRSLEKNILEPASLRSSALALKESDVGSLIFDHLSIKRGKAITVGVTTGNIDSKANEKKTKHMTLAVKQVVDTTAKGTFRSVVEILRLAAAAAADSASAEDVQKSFKEILAKLKFQVTDDASQMRSVCDKFTELRNLLAPFLVAVGAETQYGYSNLSHSELLKFFPKFVSSLEKLTEDPSPYFQPKRLKFLEMFEKICLISRKKYREMFETVFDRINNPCDLNLEIVKTILKLLTEEYLIVIDRQAKEFYIGEDCVLAQQLAKHKDIIDLVATTSLSAEHSVGITRQDLRRAPCALMSTLSLSQTFKSSPLGEVILKGKMTAEKLGEIMKETRKSGAVKLKKQLTANDVNVLNAEKKEQFAKLESEKKKIIQKKLDIAAAVKKHGGPLQTPEEVDEMCKKITDPTEQEEIINLELSYQKKVICNNTVSDERYRLKTKNKATNKFDKVPLAVKKDNLKAIVKPLDEVSQFTVTEPAVFIEKAIAKLKEKQTYPHRTADVHDVENTQLSMGDPFFNKLHTQKFVAVHCIEEAEVWWILIDALGKEFEKPNKEILTWAHHEQDNAGIGPHKGRVQTDVSCKWIRATQGHYRPENGGAGVEPMGTPVNKGIGVHVTQKRFFAGIRSQGLKPCGRMGVHFAEGHPADKRQSGSTTLYQSTAVHSEAYNPDGDNTKVMIQGSATTKNPAHAREDAKYPGLIKESDYVFNDLKGRMKDDQLLCKNEYGVVRKILNPDSDGEVNYNLFCFKYTDLEESNVEPDDYVITVRIEKLKPELWWTSVDQILRGMLMVKLRDLLSNHRFFSGLKNWEDGPFQVLYMEDTPMLVDYVSQIGVIVIVIDDMIIPGKLVKPILDEIMREQYKNSSPFGYGVMFYLYLGIPERYMSTLVWSHNEFLASILACVTLGSIILMVMVSALIAGVRSGGDADSEDGNEEEEDDNTDVNENSVAGDDEAEGAESNLKSGADNQSENNLDSGEVEGCCCDITPDKADVIVNKFNITATGEEEARTEAEAANTAAALAAETSSANLDQEDTKKTEIEKKCNLEGDDLPPPITEKEQEEGKVVDPDVCSESETDNTGKECGEVDQAEDVKIVNTEVGREEVVEDVSTGEGAPEKEVPTCSMKPTTP
ncbi:hypothetical protein ACHWQZ_G010935 [Mnemiopsis leidyi]